MEMELNKQSQEVYPLPNRSGDDGIEGARSVRMDTSLEGPIVVSWAISLPGPHTCQLYTM